MCVIWAARKRRFFCFSAILIKILVKTSVKKLIYSLTYAILKLSLGKTNYKKSRGEQEKNSAYVVVFYATQINLHK